MPGADRSPMVASLLALLFLLPVLRQPHCAASAHEVQGGTETLSASDDGAARSHGYVADEVEGESSPVARRLMLSGRGNSPVDANLVPRPKFGTFFRREMLFGLQGCAPKDVTLTQGPVASSGGIPTFSVQIINLCGVCAMGEIHVACGNWASATPVDPFVFSRLSYNDCLVNNGRPIMSQGSLTFQYANSAMYPMSITSASSSC